MIEGESGIEPVNGFALYVYHRQLNRVIGSWIFRLRQWPIPILPSSIALRSLVRAVPKWAQSLLTSHRTSCQVWAQWPALVIKLQLIYSPSCSNQLEPVSLHTVGISIAMIIIRRAVLHSFLEWVSQRWFWFWRNANAWTKKRKKSRRRGWSY